MNRPTEKRTVPSSRRSNRAAVDSRKACPQCKPGPETYTMLKGLYQFDVDLAREIVADGRMPMEMETDDVKYAVEWCVIHEPHLDHIDLKYPGIIAHYWYPDESGELLHGTVLIDGHHRAEKSLRLGVPFQVVVLSEEESKRVTLKSPRIIPEPDGNGQ